MRQRTVYIADLDEYEDFEAIESAVTRIYQRPPPPPRGLTRRRARAIARLGMVTVLLGLVAWGLSTEPPTIRGRSFLKISTEPRWTAAEVLNAPGADALATALRRVMLPSRSARLTSLGLDADTSGLPLKPVPFGGISIGETNRGQLHGGVPLPANPGLYTVRRPEFAYGSTHAVMHLQIALAKFRKTSNYAGPLIVSDLSGPRGGRHQPHLSHQSGRDVDLWLPLLCDRKGVTLKGGDVTTGRIDFEHFSAARPQEVDWNATWQLVKALARTGQVDGIFLARGKHLFLRRAALRDGLSAQEADDIIQGEQRTLNTVVRHVLGHDKHLHVRFRCADYETYCR